MASKESKKGTGFSTPLEQEDIVDTDDSKTDSHDDELDDPDESEKEIGDDVGELSDDNDEDDICDEDNQDDIENVDFEESKKSVPGIIYLSRIPPAMKPLKIRNIFSQFGEVGRLFLQPEDPISRKYRKKVGGSGRKQFTEGWVEFKDKKIAKAVARSLNNTNIGGKKRNYYHDDIWNLKYLPKFKWVHISEKLAYEKVSREQRMRTEISQVKKEAAFYLENVGKGKVIENLEKRKAKKRKATDAGVEHAEKERTKFYQKTVLKDSQEPKAKSNPVTKSTLNRSLLSKIFTSS